MAIIIAYVLTICIFCLAITVIRYFVSTHGIYRSFKERMDNFKFDFFYDDYGRLFIFIVFGLIHILLLAFVYMFNFIYNLIN